MADLTPATAHTLTVEFGRLLTEDEWRHVMEVARQIPYGKRLRLDALPPPPAVPAPPNTSPF
jgi:hypothetical protein